MKLYILSDLHREFAPFEPDPAAVAACDVVILAGDIDLGVRGIEWAGASFGTKPVIYVCGNHEFYRHHWTDLLDESRMAAQRCGVHFLEQGCVEIEGVRFLGCCLWTDFNFFPYRSVTGVMRACERGMSDFYEIRAASLSQKADQSSEARKARSKRLTPMHVRLRNRASVDWLRDQLDAANSVGVRPVVVTHHLPSEKSVAPRYAKDDLTAAFASRLDELIPKAHLWIHGHTHDSINWESASDMQSTRVICNPRGYPLSTREPMRFENREFRPGLVVAV